MNMKKTRWVAAGIVAASIGLAGCQDGQTGSGSGSGSGSTKSGELSNTELLNKATAAQKDHPETAYDAPDDDDEKSTKR